MMLANGTIQLLRKVAGGVNPETGYPIPASVEYGARIPCQYKAATFNQLANSDGNALTIARYEILIEQPKEPITSEQLCLTDKYGRTLGVFPIIQTEILDCVCKLKIHV